MTAVMQNVLQREIMVAETLKSYPYSAFNTFVTPPHANVPSLNIHQSNSSFTPYPQHSAVDGSRMSVERSSSAGGVSRNGLGGSGGAPIAGFTPSGLGAGGLVAAPLKDAIFPQRKQREFIPDNKKDESYWDRRRRNNEAAKRSREKRRFNDMILEQRVLELSRENHVLRAQVSAFENKYNVKGNGLVNEKQVLASMPQDDQILALTRRNSQNLSLLSIATAAAINAGTANHTQPSLRIAPSPHLHSSTLGGRQSHLSNVDEETSLTSPPPHEFSQEYQDLRISCRSPDYSSTPLLDQAHDQQSEEPSNLNYYEPSALNLSARPRSRSPTPAPSMDCCDEHAESLHGNTQRHSASSDRATNSVLEYSGSRNLPHKLRHKNANNSNQYSTSVSSSPPPMVASHQYSTTQFATQHYSDYQTNVRSSSTSSSSSSPSPPSSNYSRTGSTSPPELVYPMVVKTEVREALSPPPVTMHRINSQRSHRLRCGEESADDSGVSVTSSPAAQLRAEIVDDGSVMDCETQKDFRDQLMRIASDVQYLKSYIKSESRR